MRAALFPHPMRRAGPRTRPIRQHLTPGLSPMWFCGPSEGAPRRRHKELVLGPDLLYRGLKPDPPLSMRLGQRKVAERRIGRGPHHPRPWQERALSNLWPAPTPSKPCPVRKRCLRIRAGHMLAWAAPPVPSWTGVGDVAPVAEDWPWAVVHGAVRIDEIAATGSIRSQGDAACPCSETNPQAAGGVDSPCSPRPARGAPRARGRSPGPSRSQWTSYRSRSTSTTPYSYARDKAKVANDSDHFAPGAGGSRTSSCGRRCRRTGEGQIKAGRICCTIHVGTRTSTPSQGPRPGGKPGQCPETVSCRILKHPLGRLMALNPIERDADQVLGPVQHLVAPTRPERYEAEVPRGDGSIYPINA